MNEKNTEMLKMDNTNHICVGDYRPLGGYIKHRGFRINIVTFGKYVKHFRIPRFKYGQIFYTIEDAENEIDFELEWLG